jgi:large subunit ribosomal protein L4
MRVNKKMRKGALRGALTDSLQSGKLVLIKDLIFTEPKTKQAAALLDTLALEGKVLVVLDQPTDTGATEKSFRNLTGVRIAYARSLGVYELIAADKVVLTESALAVVEGAPAEAAGGSSMTKSAPSTDDTVDDSPGGADGATNHAGGDTE